MVGYRSQKGDQCVYSAELGIQQLQRTDGTEPILSIDLQNHQIGLRI